MAKKINTKKKDDKFSRVKSAPAFRKAAKKKGKSTASRKLEERLSRMEDENSRLRRELSGLREDLRKATQRPRTAEEKLAEHEYWLNNDGRIGGGGQSGGSHSFRDDY